MWETNQDKCLVFEKVVFIKIYDCSQTSLVANCLVYDGDGICTSCDTPYYLYENQNGDFSCVLLKYKPGATAQNTENCNKYHYVVDKDVCNECVQGYHFESNVSNAPICI